MAAPRVFISSTYYDLRHVREDIGNFIKTLGYDPVMHDKGGVTYTQTETLEASCYSELQNCDIVVCIIGNKYGTKSQDSDLSITMKEFMSAIKAKKKIYVYILKDVFIENKTYLANKNNDFIPASVDNIEIHKFIANIKETVKNHPIEPFENISDIIESLKKQFAGLFQRLLSQEASITEAKTAVDLQNSAERISNSISSFEKDINNILERFDSTVFRPSPAIWHLQKLLDNTNYGLFISKKESLCDYLYSIGFQSILKPEEEDEEGFMRFKKYFENKAAIITIVNDLFDDEGNILKNINKSQLDEYITYDVEETDEYNDSFDSFRDDYPF